jgi:hypothetical protein
MKKKHSADATPNADTKFPHGFPRMGRWEIDFGMSSSPLPFPVNMIFVVEHDSYFIFNMEVVSNKNPYLSFREAIWNAVMSNKMLPKSFMVKTSELARVISPIAEELGIQCEIVKRLKAIPVIRRDVTSMFGHAESTVALSKRTQRRSVISKRGVSEKSPKEVFQFKITLQDVLPKVWRRILVPSTYSFFELYVAIESAMGWSGEHLHMFSLAQKGTKDPICIELPHPDDGFDAIGDTRDEQTEKIADYFPRFIKQCLYTYDFGDDWDHTVLFEKALPADINASYPQCIGGKNACPPDDCGGSFGYERLLDILKDTKHEEHQDMLDWLCLDQANKFDQTAFDCREVVFDNPKNVFHCGRKANGRQKSKNGQGMNPLLTIRSAVAMMKRVLRLEDVFYRFCIKILKRLAKNGKLNYTE